MEIRLETVTYKTGNLTKRENKPRHPLNLIIPANQMLAVIGVSGSGKSTLGQLVAGLLRPTTGRVSVGEYVTSNAKDNRHLRQRIGFVFQYPEHQLFKETVYQDIRYGLHRKNISELAVEERIRRIMSSVGLSYDLYKNRSPFRLSGGEQRRVALAGALVTSPDVLILDEPTAGLDPVSRHQLLKLLNDIRRREGTTIILITHELQDALEHADRIITMREGEIVADMTPIQLRERVGRFGSVSLAPTAMLRFIQSFESYFPKQLPKELVREQEVIDFVAEYFAPRKSKDYP